MKTIFNLILICMAGSTSAQIADLKWAKSFGSTNEDYSYSIVNDDSGNTYTTGFFYGKVDFDPDSVKTFNVTSAGNDDIFIMKLNAKGALVWVKRIGAIGGQSGNSICLDKWGNIIVTGDFSQTVDFNPDPTKTFNLTFSGNEDAFVLKLDRNGNFKWAVKFGSSSGDHGQSVGVDNDGNVYSMGHFVNTVDFDPGSNTYDLVSKGNTDVYISKLDSGGKFVWAKQIGGTAYESCRSISVDGNGNVYTGGYFQQQVDFDPGNGIYLLGGSGQGGSYLLKLDASGNFVWAKNMRNLMEWGYSDRCIRTDAAGNIYGSGWFIDTADFNFDTTMTTNLIAKGQHDAFVFKLNDAGKYVWARGVGGNDSTSTIAEGTGMALDASGNVYTVGRFMETVDFDPGPGIHKLTTAADEDIYVSKLDSSGNFVWAISMRGRGEGYGVAVDPLKNVYTTGIFTGTVDFDPDPAKQYNLVSKGNWDFAVQKIVQCKNSNSSISTSVCNSFTLNGVTYNSTGNYEQIFPNAIGCDSIISLNLTVTVIDTGVNRIGKQLSAKASGAGYTYQWIDCKNKQPIDGKTLSSFTPVISGQYAVVISYNNCSDTSGCHAVTIVGIDEKDVTDRFSVYPNPVNSNEISLYIFQETGDFSVKLYNTHGQLLYVNTEVTNGYNSIDISGNKAGIYFLDVYIDGRVCRIKVAKQD